MTEENTTIKSRRYITILIWVLIVALLVAGGLYYYCHQTLYPSTDDAYVRSNIVNIAAQVNGPTQQIYVKNNQLVNKGQLLFIVDPAPFQFAVNKAQANLALTIQKLNASGSSIKAAEAKLAEAQVNYRVAQQNVPRTLRLVKTGSVSKSLGVEAQGQLDAAKATVAAVQSQLQEAINNFSQ